MQLHFVPDAVLFDMDGLMIDSERAVMACWRQAASEHGLPIDDHLLHGMVGLHERLCRELLSRHFPDRDLLPLFVRTNELYEAQVDAGLPLKPGIFPLLEWLGEQGMPKAVATSTQRTTAETNLARTGLGKHFSVVMTGSDIEHPKPAPDIYLKAARKLGIDPSRCLVLEDSEPGVRAALAAGMTPIQIPDVKLPSDELRAMGHRIVGSLDDAHALLRAALASREPV